MCFTSTYILPGAPQVVIEFFQLIIWGFLTKSCLTHSFSFLTIITHVVVTVIVLPLLLLLLVIMINLSIFLKLNLLNIEFSTINMLLLFPIVVLVSESQIVAMTYSPR